MSNSSVTAGQTASGLMVGSGSALYVEAGGDVSDSVVSGGGVEYVVGGTVRSTVLLSGGTMFVSAGGSASATTVSSGGAAYVASGGNASATQVSSGGLEVVESGGRDGGANVAGGGLLVVLAGGSATGTIGAGGVISGARVVLESAGGPAGLGDTVIGTTVSSGGALYVFSGGRTIGTTVEFGGNETVDGGAASATGVGFGGLQLVYGGSASGAVLGDGGRQFVYRGGVASGTVVGYAASEFVSGGMTYGTLLGAGAKEYVSGGTAYATVIDGGGYEIIESGGTADGVGVIDGGGMFVFAGGVASGAVQFSAGAGGLLSIANTSRFTATVSGLGDGDSIDLTGLADHGGATATLSGALLLVHAGAVTETITVDPAGLTNAMFEVSRDGGSGTLIAVTCFCSGTRIATPHGETAVEDLHADDMVLLADGRVLPVRWIGVQTLSIRFADPARVLPVRIAAGALGRRLPVRDLLLSPGHGVLLDGLLVQAGALAGLPGIAREADAGEVFRYYHIELDEHALLLAEGVAAESFLPTAEPAAFDNRADRPAREFCAELPYPRIKAARQIPRALREKLAGQAAA